MANIKITDLPSYPTVLSSSSDVLPIVDVTNNITKKITVDNLFAGRGGGGSGTVTSVGMTVPSALSVTPNTITTAGTFTLAWSPAAGVIPPSSLGIGASSTTFLRGDGQWVTPSGSSSGTVTSVGLQLPSAFTITGTNPITSSGTFNVAWSTNPDNKVPPILLGGTPAGDPTTLFLRADGTWVNPVGTNIGTVTSIQLTVPANQGLAVTPSTAITTAGTYALSWSTTSKIPTSSLGSGTASATTFLRGDGTWEIPSLTPTSYQQISLLTILNALAPSGATQFTLSGSYTSQLSTGSSVFFVGDGTQAYTVASISYVSATNITTVTLTSPLLESHVLGADVYYISSGIPRSFTNMILGSYLSSNLSNNTLTIEGVPTTASWLSGTQVPTASQGSTGQNYQVTSNNAIYTKTDYNVWTEQTPFENVIDSRAASVVATNVGLTQITTAGSGYSITYRLQVSSTTNLTSDVVILGFKYITTSNTIATVDLTLPAPTGGWTIGYYANFALALQVAINARSDALTVTVTSDDANVQITLVTAIPSTFLNPNPPTVASMTPTGIQTGSFLSSITIPVPASGNNPIQPATGQVATFYFAPQFRQSLEDYVNGQIEDFLEVGNYYTASITPSFTYTAISANTAYSTGWVFTNQGAGGFISHSGDITALFNLGQIITFSTSDVIGALVTFIRYDGGSNATRISINVPTAPSGLTATAVMYVLTGGNGALPASTNTTLKWTPIVNSLTNLSYNASTGVFTNVNANRRRFTFSMEVGLTVTGGESSNQADIWFLLNSTDPNSSNGRRGQKINIYPAGLGIFSHILSTSWSFSLAPNDTVITVAWMDVAGTIGTNVFGNNSSARLTIVEV